MRNEEFEGEGKTRGRRQSPGPATAELNRRYFTLGMKLVRRPLRGGNGGVWW
jgi:hypothetical protein